MVMWSSMQTFENRRNAYNSLLISDFLIIEYNTYKIEGNTTFKFTNRFTMCGESFVRLSRSCVKIESNHAARMKRHGVCQTYENALVF